MVRLKDIAACGGVSIMTVSKVLRDAPDISAATKERIRLLAQQMGYVPDSMAQGLRTRTTKLFGVVIPSLTNPLLVRVVTALEERAFELGYDVLLAHSLNLVEREGAVIRRLLSRRVDGLFIAPLYRIETQAAVFDELARRGTPTVLLGPRAPFCRHFASVQCEDTMASYEITRHLLDLGHRRIAFFSGRAASPWAQERLEGYRRALRGAGIDMDDRLVFNAGSTIEGGEKAALQMIDETPRATAIQAVNDLVAIGAANTLLNQGIRIPNQMSVAGFGNVLLSQYFRVPLTTARHPKRRLGLAAMDAMLLLLQGQRPEPKRLPAPLVVRESTAPPPLA